MSHRPGGEAALARVAIFAKPPRPGRAKTRLAAALGGGPEAEAWAAALYAAFLEDTLRKVRDEPGMVARLWAAGDPDDPTLEPLASRHNVTIACQNDMDLGSRMLAAATAELALGGPALVIGSDAPTLPGRYLPLAAEILGRHDLVLGPAADGGFYLIGFRAAPPAALFEGVPWSTSEALTATVARARALSLSVGYTPPWYDVDDLDGLRLLRAHLDAQPEAAPATAALLRGTQKLF